MKKYFALILTFALVLTMCSCFADGANDLTFGMSEEDAITIMGGAGKTDQITTSFAGILNTHIYENQSISMYDDANLNIAFMDDKLISKLYGFYPDTNANRYGYLKTALQQKYGDSGENYDFAANMLEVYGLGSIVEQYGAELILALLGAKISTWVGDDNSHITLLYMTQNNTEMTILSYIAPLDNMQITYNDSGL